MYKCNVVDLHACHFSCLEDESYDLRFSLLFNLDLINLQMYGEMCISLAPFVSKMLFSCVWVSLHYMH